MNMEILHAILGIIFCGVLLAIVYVLWKWNIRWVNNFSDQIAQNKEEKNKLTFIKLMPPTACYYIENKGNEIVEVRARYFNNVEVLIKHYTSSDAAYNRLCAEELVKKLNERV